MPRLTLQRVVEAIAGQALPGDGQVWWLADAGRLMAWATVLALAGLQ